MPVLHTWAKNQYLRYRDGVVLLEVERPNGDRANGTAFHVGDGVYITAAHVVAANLVKGITTPEMRESLDGIESGPFLHPDPNVDVACFTAPADRRPALPLGGHLDDWISDPSFVLWPTLVIGYPPVPLANSVAVAATGEINAVVDLYTGAPHPRFLISTMARGGFSGAPVLTGYAEEPEKVFVLGVVTESLVKDAATEETGFMSVLNVEAIFTCLEAHDLLPPAQVEGMEGIFNARSGSGPSS